MHGGKREKVSVFSVASTLCRKNFRERSGRLFVLGIARCLFNEHAHNVVRANALGFSVEVRENTVPKSRVRNLANIFGADMVAPLQQRSRLAGHHEGLTRTRTRPPTHIILDELRCVRLAQTGLAHKANGIFHDMFGNRNFADEVLQREDVGRTEDMFEFNLPRRGGEADDVVFLGFRRVTDKDIEHEAIELGFRERISTFLLDGVLRSHHEKGFRKMVLRPTGGDLMLLHRFEKRGLGLGRGTVDFVRKNGVGEDGAFDESQGPLAGELVFFNDFRARDIGGHQVGRELDAVEGERKRFGERRDEKRFGQAGNADEKAVSATKESNE